MQYANRDGLRSTAEPKLKAVCEHCGGAVQAKCGSKVVWHWAHVAADNCDSWYEPETQWHRDWKNHFGKERSEISIVKNGVRHIADVLTSDELVIEFQNSPISAETIVAREVFYEKMIWVLNGAPFKENFTLLDKEFLESWQVKPELVRNEKLTHTEPEARVLVVRGGYIKQEGIRAVLTRLKFIHHQQHDLYRFDLKNLYNEFVLEAKLQAGVLELYRASRVERPLKPVVYAWNKARKSWQDAQKPVFIDLGEDYLVWIKTNIGGRAGEGVKVSKTDFLKKYNVEGENTV